MRLAQLYGGRARVLDEQGEEFFPGPPAWHENDLAQAIARQPGGTAWFDARGRQARARDRGRDAHARRDPIDDQARVLRENGSPIEGLFAAGVDAGGIASGGYASGLAQALGSARGRSGSRGGASGCRDLLGIARDGCGLAQPIEKAQTRSSPGSGETPSFVIAMRFVVDLDLVAGLRRLALLLAQLVAVRRPEEEQVRHRRGGSY